jgi:outer membrane protease
MRYSRALVLAIWATAGGWAQAPPASEPGYQTLPPLTRENNPLSAPAPPESNFLQAQLGYRTWVSFGQSIISMSGSSGFPNILSELKWRHLVNPIQEFNLDMLWAGRFIARLDVGVGTAGGGGNLSDKDYDDNNRTSLSSESSHPANDNNIAYFNLDLGYRVWDVRGDGVKFTGDVLLGYQYWEEKYVASGGMQLYPDSGSFSSSRVVANTFRWNNFRIGARSELEVSRWTFGGKLMFVPANYFRDDDIHYLRTDLLQDPSFIDQATGGFGVMFDATVSYRVWQGLSLEAGYRLWYIQGGMGLDYARTTQGDIVAPLYNVQTLRQGILLGLQYRF